MRDITIFERAILAEFEAQKPALALAEPILRALRQDAIGRFAGSGLPAHSDEDWRWTDLRLLNGRQISKAPDLPFAIEPFTGPFAAIDAFRLVFVNGAFNADISSVAGLPAGVRAGGLGEALRRDPKLAENFGQQENSPFLTLSTALLNDGLFVRVDDHVRLNKPLHVVFFNTGASHVRNLILLGAGAEAALAESHYGPVGAEYFANQASDVVLGAGARLSHFRDQAESAKALHFHYLNARLDDASCYDGFSLTRGALLSRNESHVAMNGRGAACSLNGAYMLSGAQTADTTTVISHCAPGGHSRQMFRGVLDGQSRGIFRGRIEVGKAAQHTDAGQQIKALLLSKGAEQNSKPELEIFADDVKCAHGASAGQLDEAALFYLRSRGIDHDQAQAMLVSAFLDEAVTQISGGAALNAEPLQQQVRDVIEAWLSRNRGDANA